MAGCGREWVARGGRQGVAWCGGLYRAGSTPPSRYGSRESSAVSGVSAFGTGVGALLSAFRHVGVNTSLNRVICGERREGTLSLFYFRVCFSNSVIGEMVDRRFVSVCANKTVVQAIVCESA